MAYAGNQGRRSDSRTTDRTPPARGDTTEKVGKLIAERLLAKNIDKAVFDRGGFLYHGKVKALADAAREGGLKR